MSLIFRRKLSDLCLSMLVFLVITSVFRSLLWTDWFLPYACCLSARYSSPYFTAALLLHRFLRDKRRIRIIFLILLLLSTVALSVKQLAGGSEIDRLSLRSSYTQRLNSYLGVRYSWGGENQIRHRLFRAGSYGSCRCDACAGLV